MLVVCYYHHQHINISNIYIVEKGKRKSSKHIKSAYYYCWIKHIQTNRKKRHWYCGEEEEEEKEKKTDDEWLWLYEDDDKKNDAHTQLTNYIYIYNWIVWFGKKRQQAKRKKMTFELQKKK